MASRPYRSRVFRRLGVVAAGLALMGAAPVDQNAATWTVVLAVCGFLLLAAVLVLTSTASATVSPPKPTRFDPELVRRATVARSPAETTPRADAEFALTPQTEVLLDGRPCAYKSVPRGAAVTRIEVAEDRRTILRIEFKSPK